MKGKPKARDDANATQPCSLRAETESLRCTRGAGFACAIPPAAISATPKDAAATHAYVTAVYQYDQTLLNNVPASLAAAKGLASSLAHECSGVLSNVPTIANSASPTGEGLFRETSQASKLVSEATYAITAATAQPDREAFAGFANAVSPLQWSNATVTEAVRRRIVAVQEFFDAAPPNACADMHAWVGDGSRTLPSGTQEFLSRRAAMRERPTEQAEGRTIELLLAPYESASDTTLVKRAHALVEKTQAELTASLQGIVERLRVELGLPPLLGEGTVRGKVIGRGRTAAGERFQVRLESGGSSQPGCGDSVSIESSSRDERGSGAISLGLGGICLSGRYSGPASSVDCSAGLLTVSAFVPIAARIVTLRLSDGRRVSSPAIHAPGEREGYYYQAVRGPTPIPVSLIELDSHGRALRVVKLVPVVECTKHPLRYLDGGPRTLVHGSVPGGPAFSIVAERYRFLGKIYFEFKVHVAEAPGTGARGVGSGGTFFGNGERPAFAPEEDFGCEPRFYDIVYGLLKPPSASVVVDAGGVRTRLSNMAVPSYLHAGGVLAYGAFSAPPGDLVVKDVHEHVLSRLSLNPPHGLPFERCEGETEGGGNPAPGRPAVGG